MSLGNTSWPPKKTELGYLAAILGAMRGEFFDDVGTERVEAFGVIAVVAHVIDKVVHLADDVGAKAVDFVGALEIAGVDDADLDEDEILEHGGEDAQDAVKGVEAEAVETADEDHGGLGARVAIAARAMDLSDVGHAGFGGGGTGEGRRGGGGVGRCRRNGGGSGGRRRRGRR